MGAALSFLGQNLFASSTLINAKCENISCASGAQCCTSVAAVQSPVVRRTGGFLKKRMTTIYVDSRKRVAGSDSDFEVDLGESPFFFTGPLCRILHDLHGRQNVRCLRGLMREREPEGALIGTYGWTPPPFSGPHPTRWDPEPPPFWSTFRFWSTPHNWEQTLLVMLGVLLAMLPQLRGVETEVRFHAPDPCPPSRASLPACDPFSILA